MALRNDTYFGLSKGERRATLWLVIVVVILVTARIVQQYRPQSDTSDENVCHEAFQKELKEFGDSLRQEKSTNSSNRKTATHKTTRPKDLDPVPREE